LKRSDPGLAQDVWSTGSAPLSIPSGAKIFVYLFIDPADPPRAVMVQFRTDDWRHRAVWGDYEAIPWGQPHTTERVNMGALPAAGEWIRLEIAADRVGLSAGDTINGFALTQFGGTVYWDKAGVVGTSDSASDPRRSFQVWWRQAAQNDVAGLPSELSSIARQGPDKGCNSQDAQRLLAYYLQSVCEETKPTFMPLMGKLSKLRETRKSTEDAIPGTFVFKDLDQPRQSYVMIRGAYDKPGEKVEPGVPAVLPPLPVSGSRARATRLDLAEWLVSSENPLTARVTVNRFWQQVFGTGLVKTSYDFGSQGDTPSHPELLDWLAIHFRETGWNVKELMRLMLTSATFRQSSRVDPDVYAKDPQNRLYARGPRLRLDAEQIRDNALFVSGLIDFKMGGKGVKPYQPVNIWEPVGFAGSNTRFYTPDTGSALYRRSLYTFLKRTAPPPFMANFDAPNREQFCTRRDRSNTPLQALQLMNDVQHVEAARALAERMLMEGGAGPAERITFACRLVLARVPDREELEVIQGQLQQHLDRYQHDSDAAMKLISQGESRPKTELGTSELAAYTLVANMLLNLDETLTRN
jgi:hypothetical protein